MIVLLVNTAQNERGMQHMQPDCLISRMRYHLVIAHPKDRVEVLRAICVFINFRRRQPPFILFATGVVGLEPTAANLEDWYSIQLSYTPIIGSPDRT